MSSFHKSFEEDGTTKIKGDTDDTLIGNVGDDLKVIDEEAISILNLIAAGVGVSGTSIFKQNEADVASKNLEDLASTSYTVPAGKDFFLTSFNGSYDEVQMIFIRIEKQDLGSGPFNTIFRMTMMNGGSGNPTISMNFGSGIKVGIATDVFKITYDAAVKKGSIWASYSGLEV